MRMLDQVDNAVSYAITTFIGGVAAGTTWIVRRVLTNEKKVALLEHEVKHREEMRRSENTAMREDLQGVRGSVEKLHDALIEVIKESRK